MSVGQRLRDERIRLGLSQPAFAALAGASKGAQQNWEKDVASPNAAALIAWGEAGADVLYILTGRRTADRPDEATANLEDQLASIRRDMLVHQWERAAGDPDDAAAETRVMGHRAGVLRKMLQGKAGQLTPELTGEIESLLAIITNPAQLDAYRAADHAQRRARRRRLREQIHAYTDLGDFQPNDDAINTMVTIALDYGVPVSLLSELVYDIAASEDGGGFRSGSLTA